MYTIFPNILLGTTLPALFHVDKFSSLFLHQLFVDGETVE